MYVKTANIQNNKCWFWTGHRVKVFVYRIHVISTFCFHTSNSRWICSCILTIVLSFASCAWRMSSICSFNRLHSDAKGTKKCDSLPSYIFYIYIFIHFYIHSFRLNWILKNIIMFRTVCLSLKTFHCTL